METINEKKLTLALKNKGMGHPLATTARLRRVPKYYTKVEVPIQHVTCIAGIYRQVIRVNSWKMFPQIYQKIQLSFKYQTITKKEQQYRQYSQEDQTRNITIRP